MIVTRNSLETGKGTADWFTGAVYVDTVAAPAGSSRLNASSVHFTPGARTAWHTHPNGQTIFVTEGVGRLKRSIRATAYSSGRAGITGMARRRTGS